MSSFRFDQFARTLVTGGTFDWVNEPCAMTLYRGPINVTPDMQYAQINPYMLAHTDLQNQTLVAPARLASESVEFIGASTPPGEVCKGAILYRKSDQMLLLHLHDGSERDSQPLPFDRELHNERVILHPNGRYQGSWAEL